MTEETDGWGQIAELRQGFYRFFGGAMLPPDAARLDGILAAADTLDAAGVEDFAFLGQWRSFMRTLDELPPLEEMEAAYIRLFVPGAGAALCPALESEYAVGQHQRVAMELEERYRDMGLALAPHLPHTADHAATQLEAMAFLCHREAHAWEEEAHRDVVEALRAEWSFLHRHLARWLPRFARRLHEVSRDEFYVALVEAADAFVQHDHELVTVLARTRLATASAMR